MLSSARYLISSKNQIVPLGFVAFVDINISETLSYGRFVSFSFSFDTHSPSELVDLKMEKIQHGSLDVVIGAGHLLSLEKPDETGTTFYLVLVRQYEP